MPRIKGERRQEVLSKHQDHRQEQPGQLLISLFLQTSHHKWQHAILKSQNPKSKVSRGS
jgi:hypothetical protein